MSFLLFHGGPFSHVWNAYSASTLLSICSFLPTGSSVVLVKQIKAPSPLLNAFTEAKIFTIVFKAQNTPCATWGTLFHASTQHLKGGSPTPAGVAQWTELRRVVWKVAGSTPAQVPHLHMDASLPLSLPSPLSEICINKIFKKFL